MSVESKILFNDLPTEIIFHIFDYLSNNDIIYTFFYLNQRLNNVLLNNKRYLNYFELPTTNISIWKNILSNIVSQIEILNISTIDITFQLSLFPNLKSIIISSSHGFPDEELISIIECDIFKYLHCLIIKENKIFPDPVSENFIIKQNIILKKIFNYKNSLKTFQYSSVIPPLAQTDINTFQIYISLYSLTLILTDFKDIYSVIFYTPNLKYLNIQCESPYQHHNPIININIKLKQFYLKLIQKLSPSYGRRPFQIDFNQLFNCIKQFSSSLVCLSLDFVELNIETEDEFPFNSIKLQQLLESMRELKNFYLYAKLYTNSYNANHILSKFKNQYYLDHNLSFGMHLNYFYTLPFHFDHLYEIYNNFNDIKSNHPEIFHLIIFHNFIHI
ncbi:unnamed protein product [Rotaria sp. Silwood2]|nr:unnamed protein product [Rotaria sp. Silwood2]